MKRFFLICLLLLIGFFLGFEYREIQGKIEVKARPTTYATEPVMGKKGFVVIVSAKDASSYSEQNILSILNQSYENYRVIYIDNGSADRAAEKALAFLKNHDVDGRVDFIKSEPGSSEGENLYRAVHFCQNHEIIVLLRGDEFFTQNTALETLNRYFADPNVWMLGGDEVLYSTYNKVKNSYFYRAFYSGLFKQIKLEEFLSEGTFRKEKYEKILFPSLKELAGSHAFRVSDPLFICQEEKEDISSERKFFYSPMKENPWHDFSRDKENVDLLVFSYNCPLQLHAFLESSEKYLENLHHLYVIYQASNEHYEKGYHEVKKDFPHATYVRKPIEKFHEDFSSTVRRIVFDVSSARYMMFALDDFIFKEPLDFNESARLLKETGAYGFYFCLGNHLKTCPMKNRIFIREGVYGWQFSSMEGEWRSANSIKMTLFKKDEIYSDFLYMKFHNPNLLEVLWNESADLSRVGLYYDRSKAVSAPLISRKELLSFFDQGLKMDITSLDRIENQTIEISFEPEFTKR